jgi:AraC-like DNA-binding protein
MSVGTHALFPEARSFFGLSADELADSARRAAYRQRKLAARLNLSSRTLERYFQTRFGKTPSQWIGALRMGDAADFLMNGGSIKQAAGAVAFRHDTSFFREFRRHFRCTPLDYTQAKATIRSATAEFSPQHGALSQSASILSQSASAASLRPELDRKIMPS